MELRFDNLEEANAWIAKAAKELKSQRRDWFKVNAMMYSLGLHGYELAIKEINTLLGDRPRDHNGPYPEDNVPEDLYDPEKTRGWIRNQITVMDDLAGKLRDLF